jgi:hypothetical protein
MVTSLHAGTQRCLIDELRGVSCCQAQSSNHASCAGIWYDTVCCSHCMVSPST